MTLNTKGKLSSSLDSIRPSGVVLPTSGVARISKLGGTPVTWPKGSMRGVVFGGGAVQWAPSLSARRSGREL